LAQVAEEESDAEELSRFGTRPKDTVVPAWAGTVWRAWHALRFDRQYGAFGGESQISFTAIDRYATRYGISGTAFESFMALLCAMDDEYLQHVARVAEANKTKTPESQ
jgi:hypothetical protein